MTEITLQTEICAPIEKVFHFHDDPENLLRITPSNYRVTIERFDPPGKDSIVVLLVKPFPLITSRWEMVFSQYESPILLEDTQKSGPFKSWRHTRRFEASDKRTILKETIRYELPFGFLGRLIDRLIIRRLNNRMFAYRHKKMKEFLESDL